MESKEQAVSGSVVEGVKLHVVPIHELPYASSPGHPEGRDQDQVVAVVVTDTVVVFIASMKFRSMYGS